MGYVGVCLKHIVGSDAGLAVFAGRAVDGGEFSDFIFVPDDDGAVFTFEFQVLRRFSDDGVREDVGTR